MDLFLEDHGENGVAVPGIGVPPQNPESAPEPIPVGTVSCNAQYVDVSSHTNGSTRQENQQETRKNPIREEREADRRNGAAKPQHVVHMIIKGTNIPQGPIIKRVKVSTTTEGLIRGRMSKDILAFSEEDFETLTRLHNDALVISFLLNNI